MQFELSHEVFPAGLSPTAMNRLFKLINRRSSLQTTAATATLLFWVAEYDGRINDIEAVLGTLPASGESMVIDVRKNGSTILTGTLTVNSSTTNKFSDMKGLIDPALAIFSRGDVFSVVRTYTAGGGPAMVTSQVTIFPGLAHE